jgi:hypothetical protein
MQMTLRKWTIVFIVLLASAYLFAGVASLIHFHKNDVDNKNCLLCYYYQNYHSQELTAQSSVVTVLSFQTFTLPKPVVLYTKVVFYNEPSRAPPRLQCA